MKRINRIFMAGAAAVALSLSSCVGDLNVTPIDPNIQLPSDVLNSQEAYNQLLAKVYQGLACSSSYGQDGSPDISGVDGGYGQYLRAMFHLQCLSTDEAVCCWNDQTLYDIHNLCWSTSDTFVAAAYYRVFFQIGLANEFIRQAKASTIDGFDMKAQYIAEARALRLLSYYHAIDLFGNVPFTTEENSVGSEGPQQKSRADLWNWMVTECQDLLSAESALPAAGKTEYGRIDKGAVKMILAKLYLNAQVWKDPSADFFADCAKLCKELMSEYSLHAVYADLFCADNHLCTKPRILPITVTRLSSQCLRTVSTSALTVPPTTSSSLPPAATWMFRQWEYPQDGAVFPSLLSTLTNSEHPMSAQCSTLHTERRSLLFPSSLQVDTRAPSSRTSTTTVPQPRLPVSWTPISLFSV